MIFDALGIETTWMIHKLLSLELQRAKRLGVLRFIVSKISRLLQQSNLKFLGDIYHSSQAFPKFIKVRDLKDDKQIPANYNLQTGTYNSK